MRYRAFLSYSHKDKSWADWLHKVLEGYRVPKQLVGTAGRDGPIPAKLFPVFRDREELPSASDLNSQISDALRESEYLIVICSPHAAKSHWVNEEILSYKRLGRENRILALIVDGEPNAPGDQECFPEALKYRLGADGKASTELTEPIAADARETGDGRENAKLKLVAGLLGVGFNDLKHRELEAAKRRLRIFQGVAASMTVLALLAVAGGVMSYRYMQRSNEMTEASVKIVAGFTNEVISLRNELPQATLDRFVVQINQQLSGLFKQGVHTQSIDEQQAILLQLFAEHYDDSGDAKRELVVARQLVAARSRLLSDTPDDPGAKARFASAQRSLGQALARNGELKPALAAYRTSAGICEDLLQRDPNNIAKISDTSSSWMAISTMLRAQGETTAAIKALRKSIGYTATLLRRQPGNPEWQSDLANIFSMEGELFLEKGMVREALAVFREDEKFMARLAAAYPANLALGEFVADAKVLQARALTGLGRASDAAAMYAQAAAIYRRTLRIDPKRVYSLQRLATVLADVGGSGTSSAAPAERLAQLEESAGLFRRLLMSEPRNTDLLQGLAIVDEGIGYSYYAMNNRPKALEAFADFETQSSRLCALDNSQVRCPYFPGRAMTDTAGVLNEVGQRKEALAKYDAGIAALKVAAKANPRNPAIAETLADATARAATLTGNSNNNLRPH